MLRAAVRREADSRGHTVTDYKASGNSKTRIGDDNAYGVEERARAILPDNFPSPSPRMLGLRIAIRAESEILCSTQYKRD